MTTHRAALHPSLDLSEALVDLREQAREQGLSDFQMLWVMSGSSEPFPEWFEAFDQRWQSLAFEARPALLRFVASEVLNVPLS